MKNGIDAMIEDGASLYEIEKILRLRRNRKMKRQFFIAGVQFRPRTEIDMAAKTIEVGGGLILKPEPTNKFDPNAVQILTTEDVFLGYVPKKFSSEVSAMLSIGAPVQCIVDEVNASAKTYEMFKVTISIPVDAVESEDEE